VISQQLQNIITFLRRNRMARPDTDIDVTQARAVFEMAGQFFPPPEGTVEDATIVGGVPGLWVRAPGATDDITLLYLHGGGYAIGSPNTHRGLIGSLSAAIGGRVLAPDYRLAPEQPFPAAVDDAVAVYRALVETTPAERVAIGGDSAGGGLTLALLVALRDAGDRLPACAFALSPWTDLASTGATMSTRAEDDPLISLEGTQFGSAHYLAGADPKHPLASPLYADLHGLPPLLIQAGDAEVLLDDSVRLAARARECGVDVTLDVWPEMIHVWQFFAGQVPEADDAIGKIAAFVRSRID